MMGDVFLSRLQGIDKAQRDLHSGFARIMVHGRLDIQAGQFSRDNRFAVHLLRWPRARSRKLAK